jgi:carboxymethylenebutenolidase
MQLRRASICFTVVGLAAACGGGGPTAAPATAAPPSTAVTAPASASPGPTSQPTAEPLPQLNGERVAFQSGDLTLGGMLWKPAGNGPFRAVLWNHGSEKGPGADGSNPVLGPVFTSQDYVFFMPMRRGQGTSEGTWIVDATNAAAPADRPTLIAELHTTEQLLDQVAGLEYLRSLPYVDPNAIAVAGWSYGGIQTVLGAGRLQAGYVAAVAFTPASQSWAGNPDLQQAMTSAATRATIPFLFIQAENDYSLVPTQALTDAITADGGTATRSIYPAFGETNQDGHELAVRGSDLWRTEVFAFLAAAFGS